MIVSRWQSLPEMFTDGEAVFIEPGSVEALVTALRDFVAEPRQLHERSGALKRRARDFDAEDVFRDFLRVCSQIAKRAEHQTKKQAN
jgi:glycosyltransferase involved in cell wall biosynthesis